VAEPSGGSPICDRWRAPWQNGPDLCARAFPSGNSLKFLRSSHGRKAAKKFQINWSDILPLEEIADCRNEKIVQFREKQLSRWSAMN
jgi:hypothetical protein